MLGGIGSNILSYLRFLTPSQVHKLTVEALTRGSICPEEEVAVGMDFKHGEQNQEQLLREKNKLAQILPFNQNTDGYSKKKSNEELQQEAANRFDSLTLKQKEEFILKSLNIHKKKKKKKVVGGEDFEEEAESIEVEEELSSTAFLIQEKAKIRQSQLKLSEQTALKSYRTQAAIDTAHEDKEDLTQSSSSGILINKRQF
jgi:hypothetical protein